MPAHDLGLFSQEEGETQRTSVSVATAGLHLVAFARSVVLESRCQPGVFLIGLGCSAEIPAFSLMAFTFVLALDQCEASAWHRKAELWPSAPGSILESCFLPRGNFQFPEVLWNLGN